MLEPWPFTIPRHSMYAISNICLHRPPKPPHSIYIWHTWSVWDWLTRRDTGILPLRYPGELHFHEYFSNCPGRPFKDPSKHRQCLENLQTAVVTNGVGMTPGTVSPWPWCLENLPPRPGDRTQEARGVARSFSWVFYNETPG